MHTLPLLRIPVVMYWIAVSLLAACQNQKTSDNPGNSTGPTGDRLVAEEEKRASLYKCPLRSFSDSVALHPDGGIAPAIEPAETAQEGRLEILPLPGKARYDLKMYVPTPEGENEITLTHLDLRKWVPQNPPLSDRAEYLDQVSRAHRSWNRQEVQLGPDHLILEKIAPQAPRPVRVDLIRNGLHPRIWEVMIYHQPGKDRMAVYYHRWFEFPGALYRHLFEQRNGVPFRSYNKALAEWTDPEPKPVQLGVLREVAQQLPTERQALDDASEGKPADGTSSRSIKPGPYPGLTARFADSILYPTPAQTMDRPLSDLPRVDSNGLGSLDSVSLRRVRFPAPADHADAMEIVLHLRARAFEGPLRLVVGGMQLTEIPMRAPEQLAAAHEIPLGIASHPFYQTYESMSNPRVSKAVSYALLLDDQKAWKDPRSTGLESVRMHISPSDPNQLHLWLMHRGGQAVSAHYIIDIEAYREAVDLPGPNA